MFLVLLLIALAPCLFLLWYFYHRDKYEPEPKKKILKIFFTGVLMTIPAVILEYGFGLVLDKLTSGFINIFILSFIIIAAIEEYLKYVVVMHGIYKSFDFNEVMDGIVYTVSASLGFATFENILYVFAHGIGIGIARAFSAVPGHAFFGALMGYYIGLAKLNPEKEKHYLTKALIFAIVAHGLYDFLLFTKTALAALVIVLIIFLGLLARRNLKKAEIQSQQNIEKEKSDQTTI